METTESKAISSLSVYMYFADISIVNSGMHEAYAYVYHLVIKNIWGGIKVQGHEKPETKSSDIN